MLILQVLTKVKFIRVLVQFALEAVGCKLGAKW